MCAKHRDLSGNLLQGTIPGASILDAAVPELVNIAIQRLIFPSGRAQIDCCHAIE